ncbi:CPBP family intramembrane glutamic endopeptidase [Natronolimnohabitans innermongolicus]|uniref:Abortive infection protein n=1 Tax=Natronolimnohabitans innermongolicus JCM 12255 TaxID=1227499 RepID=L9X2R9_9EURY|nr:type II CAAX endopeptidase family protein [Natronolimnohabitans innermongolicus]ELY55776.1 abortive infection protein [Natronolimnohabitans innermongolicus JCM 12255]
METSSSSPDADADVTRDGAPLRSILVAVGLTVFGLFVLPNFTTLPAFLLDPAMIEGLEQGSLEGRSLALALNFVGMALAGIIYLLWTDRGLGWIDLRVPTATDWKYLILGSIGSIAFLYAISIIFTLLGVTAAESNVMDIVGEDQTMILIMIVIVFFFNAPAEEFLFRNIIQKRLYEAFSRMQAIVVTSVIFAAVHFPMYMFAETMVATMASLTVMFGGSVIFGYVYAKTDNLLVPTAAHAVLNAFQFVMLYIAIEYDIEQGEPAPSLLVDALSVLPL